MVFNGLPTVFDDKVQNIELYVQKRIYDSLKFLTTLPVVQNETGLYTNYITDEVDVGNPEYSNNGIDFNEIKFGAGQTVGGQTLPYGFMYRANTRDKQRGKYMSNLLSFLNTATVRMSDFYEEKYANNLINNGRQSTATLDKWDSAEHIINNEVTLDDEMRYDLNGNSTGYSPNIVFCNRKRKLEIEKELRKEEYTSNLTYIASVKVPENIMLFFDTNNPSVQVEKYADPEYSVIQTLEDDGITEAVDGSPIPPAFINYKSEDTGRPQTVDNYIWAESNLNIMNRNGILIVKDSNSTKKGKN